MTEKNHEQNPNQIGLHGILILVQYKIRVYYALNTSGHQHCFLQWTWEVRQILLRGSNFGLRFFTCRKSTTRDPWLYFPSEGSHTRDFCALRKPSTPAGFEPANHGSSGEYDNHGTTGVDNTDPVCYHCANSIDIFIYFIKLVKKLTIFSNNQNDKCHKIIIANSKTKLFMLIKRNNASKLL